MPTLTREEYPSLRLPSLRRAGALKPGASKLTGWSADGELLTAVRTTANHHCLTIERVWPEAAGVELIVPWTTTASPYGDRRWFSAPCCDRPVAALYDGRTWMCCQCLGAPSILATVSRVERLQVKRRRCRMAVGLPALGSGGFPQRPKGMRSVTWTRLLDQWNASELAVVDHVASQLSAIRHPGR